MIEDEDTLYEQIKISRTAVSIITIFANITFERTSQCIVLWKCNSSELITVIIPTVRVGVDVDK